MPRVGVNTDTAEVLAALERAARALEPPAITEAVEAATDVFGGGARRRAPKRSGRLAESIKKRKITDTSYEVATELVYANITEFGGTIRPDRRKVLKFASGIFSMHAKIPAQPYMIPTFEQDSEKAFNAFADKVDRSLDKGA